MSPKNSNDLPISPLCVLQKENHIPTSVCRTVFLHVRTYLWLLKALLLRAVGRKRLATVVPPVGKPATTLAGVVAGAIDIPDFHWSPALYCPIVIATSVFGSIPLSSLFLPTSVLSG